MQLVAVLVWFATLAVAVLVWTKLLQKEGPVMGILGLFCMLYTFIWGWVNAVNQHITNLMWIWTCLMMVGILLNAMMGMQVFEGGTSWLQSLI